MGRREPGRGTPRRDWSGVATRCAWGHTAPSPAHAIGGLLGAHDLAPLELLATGRRQLAELRSVRLIDGEATRVDGRDSVTLADGTVPEHARGHPRDRHGLKAVLLPDGSEVPRDVLFVAAPPTPRDAAFVHLTLERSGPGLIGTDPFGLTTVDGVYAAGDLVSSAPAVVQALATGQRAAVGVTRELSGA